MATTETKILDNIIASRRALLVSGGAALASLALPKAANAALAPASIADTDILNFALNLEYLESNFYYLAAFGCTIDKPNAAAMAAGAPSAGIGIGAGTTTTGTTATVTGTNTNLGTAGLVPFMLPAVKSYAQETAIEEGKHVLFLRTALGSAAVAQPAIDVSPTAFTTVANAAGISGTFNPYSADAFFLVGAYIFEDVGVTAYHGAAPLISTTTTGKTYLAAAASILAVEAYHGGLVRTTINILDPVNAAGYLTLTSQVSALRAKLSKAVAPAITASTGTVPAYPTGGSYGDDAPLTPATATASLAGASAVTVTTTADVDPTNPTNYQIAFARTTNEVLNIVTGGVSNVAGAKATGVFFPSGLNGAIA